MKLPVVSKRKRLHHGYISLLGTLFRTRGNDGIKVMEQEWDHLLVLDACRYDTFEAVNELPGELTQVKSQATSTPQWLKRNFTDQYDDIVYVAGNPYVSNLANDGYFDAAEHFHHVEHVWDHGWEETIGVPPEAINEAASEIREQYPDKRLVLHYMQPHEPFLGETNFHDMRGGSWDDLMAIWDSDDVADAYRENLELVLDAIEDVLPQLDGDVVITADHGELLEWTYGLIRHPKDVFISELQDVPWFRVDMAAYDGEV